MVGSRWWTRDELDATGDTVYPEGLLDIIRSSDPASLPSDEPEPS